MISIKWKLLAICVLLVTLPTIFFGLLGYNRFKQITEQNTETLMRKIVLDWSQVADSYIKQVDRVLRREEALVKQRLKAIVMSNRQLLSYANETGAPDLKKIEDKLMEISIGRSGFIFMADAQGRLFFPRKEGWEGKKITNFLSSDNDVAANQFINYIKKFTSNDCELFNFASKDIDTGQVRKQVVALTYFEQWDIIIGALTFHTDYKSHKLEKQLQNELRYRIADQRIGEHGYIWVLNSQGDYVVSLDRMRDGENIINYRDSNGTYLVQEIIDRVKALPAGETLIQRYRWQNLDENSPLQKTAAFTYVPEWDWIMGASAYEVDYFKGIDRIQWHFILFCAAIIMVGSAISYFFTLHITRPINILSRLSLRVACGDLETKIDNEIINQPNEIGQLATAFQTMTGNLKMFFQEKEAFSQKLIKANRELGAAKNGLEEEVKKRTIELERRMGELKDEISERIKVEEEREHLRNYLSSIINSMPSILAGVDQDLNITNWNKQAVLITGITAESAMGKSLDAVMPDREGLKDLVTESIAKRVSTTKRSSVLLNDDTRYEMITIYPILSDDDLGAVIRIDDITKEVELQQQLNQSQKMDAIGQLASGLAHDFNNMIGGIMGAAELLSFNLNNEERATKYVNIIMEASSRAAGLTENLLTFSRNSPMVTIPVDVHKIISDTIALLDNSIDKRIHLSQDLNAKYYMVVGDPSQLQNVFLNMGINSSHAIEESGEISFTTKNITLDSNYGEASSFDLEPGGYLSIEIHDTGTGIPKNQLSKVFEPFFTTKEQGKGTGLGLASVFGTVQQHNGSITVYSEVGKGTVFRLLLPYTDIPVDLQEETEIKLGSGCVLVADDDTIMRTISKAVLEKVGYEVIQAENGQEAVELFRKEQEKVDVVMLDMIMPVMNGRDSFERIRAIDPEAVVVLCSGFSKAVYLHDMRLSGLNGYIQKPFMAAELSQVLYSALHDKKNPPGKESDLSLPSN